MSSKVKKLFQSFLILTVLVVTTAPEVEAKHHRSPLAKMGKSFKKLGKDLKGIGNILDKGLKKAGLPGIGDIKRIIKGLPTLAKDIAYASAHPTKHDAFTKLHGNGVVAELQIIDEDCGKPGLLVASMMPEVGGLVAAVCGRVGAMNASLQGVLNKMEMAVKMSVSSKNGDVEAEKSAIMAKIQTHKETLGHTEVPDHPFVVAKAETYQSTPNEPGELEQGIADVHSDDDEEESTKEK